MEGFLFMVDRCLASHSSPIADLSEIGNWGRHLGLGEKGGIKLKSHWRLVNCLIRSPEIARGSGGPFPQATMKFH